MKFFKNNRGATAVEFGLVALPVLLFLFGIIQTGYIVWTDNLLHISVDTAARCAAVNSTTSPCQGTDAVTPAQTVFGWSSGAAFSSSNCTADGGTGNYRHVSYHNTIRSQFNVDGEILLSDDSVLII